MKKLLILALLVISKIVFAQFTIKATAPVDFRAQEAYLYALNGSKDIVLSKSIKSNNIWMFKVDKPYIGMLKIYFPETNTSISLASENKDAQIKFLINNNKATKISYLDETNFLLNQLQDQQRKKEQILPALFQMKSYYLNDSEFGKAMEKEINYLDSDINYNKEVHTFVKYYTENYRKFLSESATNPAPKNEEIITFITTTNEFLETSSLLKPILLSFLSNTNKENLSIEVEKLLSSVNIETPRGQTVLSELIEIFDVYSIRELKEKYLEEAKNLKCTINERLQSTIKSNNLTEIGSKIPNTTFKRATNTKMKTLHDVKASNKIIILWASTCSHCEKEISEMLIKYPLLKAKNIEIVGLSLDSDEKSYSDKVKILPWINDTEIRGWYSSYVDTYNVHATPTFYIVDSQNKIISKPDNFNEILDFFKMK